MINKNKNKQIHSLPKINPPPTTKNTNKQTKNKNQNREHIKTKKPKNANCMDKNMTLFLVIISPYKVNITDC
jgi:hypothetical protein